MLREMCMAKIHNATVTGTHLEYEGSIGIDVDLIEAAGILPYEKLQIINKNNGSRTETYVIEGKRGSGEICINGGAARWALPGDKVILITYGQMEEEKARDWKPTIVLVDENNKPQKILNKKSR